MLFGLCQNCDEQHGNRKAVMNNIQVCAKAVMILALQMLDSSFLFNLLCMRLIQRYSHLRRSLLIAF